MSFCHNRHNFQDRVTGWLYWEGDRGLLSPHATVGCKLETFASLHLLIQTGHICFLRPTLDKVSWLQLPSWLNRRLQISMSHESSVQEKNKEKTAILMSILCQHSLVGSRKHFPVLTPIHSYVLEVEILAKSLFSPSEPLFHSIFIDF